MIPDAEFACVACGGRGCEACDDTGVWHVNECPQKMLDSETLATLDAVEMARAGLWPVGGGSLDQTEWFAEAFRYVGREMPEGK